MPDWSRSMQQTYEFMTVNPRTWVDQEKLSDITQATITRDDDDETCSSASIDCDHDLSDTYVRVYLRTVQDNISERIPLGTFLCQTPGQKYDGKKHSMSADGYSPLVELNENYLPYGFAIPKGDNILVRSRQLVRDYLRAPVLDDKSERLLQLDFVSEPSEKVLPFVNDLLANDGRKLGLDEMGRVIFPIQQDITMLEPRWTYTDDNSSILYPEVQLTRDLYGVPNVVEVLYSGNDVTPIYVRVENNDRNSVVSIPARGREIVHRDTNPDLSGTDLTEPQIEEYAQNLLKTLSSLEYEISYTHGYCPVRVGDCVRLDYRRAGLIGVKAKVTRQIITCTPGCPVQETAVFSRKLWG